MQAVSVEDRRLVIGDPSLSDLSVTNKSLLTIAAVAACGNHLASVNLSFNDITSLAPLAGCASLATLNVSHNKLKTLAGCPRSLRSLKCTHNEISSLDGVRACLSIGELWASNNGLNNLGAVVSIVSEMQSLRTLIMMRNPCCLTEPPELYRNAIINGMRASGGGLAHYFFLL